MVTAPGGKATPPDTGPSRGTDRPPRGPGEAGASPFAGADHRHGTPGLVQEGLAHRSQQQGAAAEAGTGGFASVRPDRLRSCPRYEKFRGQPGPPDAYPGGTAAMWVVPLTISTVLCDRRSRAPVTPRSGGRARSFGAGCRVPRAVRPAGAGADPSRRVSRTGRAGQRRRGRRSRTMSRMTPCGNGRPTATPHARRAGSAQRPSGRR